jgi:hypothetical protein
LHFRTQDANLLLFRAIACFYAMQTTVSALGRPECHVSTGCHQKVGESKKVKDIMGYDREEHLTSAGAQVFSKTDYEVSTVQFTL